MAEDVVAAGPLPVVSFLKIPEKGDPYLEAYKCGNCGSIFLGVRSVCSNCAARDQMKPTKLSSRRLRLFSPLMRFNSSIVPLRKPRSG